MEMYGAEWAAKFEEYANASIAGRDGLFRLAVAALDTLPEDARVLVVGCGTGTEILALASRHPGWRFEAVEPAPPMLEACRMRLQAAEISHRVNLHQRNIEGLRVDPCDAATAILVSQHLVSDIEAQSFFAEIAANLLAGAPLFSADITRPDDNRRWDAMLRVWGRQAVTAGLPEDAPAKLVDRFGRDLLPRPPERIEAILSRAGFASPLQLFQSTIYRAWLSYLG